MKSLIKATLFVVAILTSIVACNMPAPNTNPSIPITIINTSVDCMLEVQDSIMQESHYSSLDYRLTSRPADPRTETPKIFLEIRGFDDNSDAQLEVMNKARTQKLLKDYGHFYEFYGVKMEVVHHAVFGKVSLLTKTSAWDPTRGQFFPGNTCNDSMVLFY